MVGWINSSKGFLTWCWTLAVVIPIGTARANSETVLYSFQNNGADGNIPGGNLTEVNGTLYGTTVGGGAADVGTVYSISPSTGKEAVLYSFKSNGEDGNNPESGLINVNGALFGTTFNGGADGDGTVYSINASTGAETVLYSFQSNGDDGIGPYASLTKVNGMLYGTTLYGGADGGAGTVFSVNPATGAETVLHSFSSEDQGGYNPQAGLTHVHGVLYGTATNGGEFGNGAVFSIDPSTGTYAVLHSFGTGADGDAPESNLISVHGTLYGTTFGGGTGMPCGGAQSGCGTVFSIDLRTGKESVLYAFKKNGADGTTPVAGLIDVQGTLYGTTILGGDSNAGTGYSINLSTGAETVLYSFKSNGEDGTHPYASLIDFGNALYGTTAQGGAQNEGTVFKIKP